jgi:UPF0755 protein
MDDSNKPTPPDEPAAALDDPQERGKSPTRWILRGVLFMFALVAAVLGYALYLMGPTGTTAEIRIPKGSGAAAVGRILEQAGLVRSGSMFALYLRFSGQDKELKPGYYKLEGKGLRAIAPGHHRRVPPPHRAHHLPGRLAGGGYGPAPE